MDLDEFISDTRKSIEDIGRTLPSDGDWAPVLLTWSPATDVIVHALEIGDEIEKAMMYGFLVPALIEDEAATMAICINTAWLSFPKPEGFCAATGAPIVPPSEDPDRSEVVSVVGADWTGVARMLSARIDRSGAHPTLEWEDFPEEWTVGGAIATSLLLALRLNASRVSN